MAQIDTISFETVTKTWRRIDRMSLDEVVQMGIQFQQEQPVVFNFLADLGPLFNRSERELIIYLGTAVWQMMKQSARPLGQVTQKNLEKVHIANFNAVDMMLSDSEADFASATLRMIEKCPEIEVFRYITREINREKGYNPGNKPIRDDHRAVIFVHLKTVLDAFVSALA